MATMNRASRCRYLSADVINSPVRSRKMTRFHRSIARFAFPAPARPALASRVRRAGRRGHARHRRRGHRRAAGAEPMTAPGTWSSPPRGAIAVPATASPSRVIGSRVSSAGGGRVSGTVNRAGGGGGQCFGRRIHGERRRPARRRLAARAAGSGIITGDRCSGTWQATRS